MFQRFLIALAQIKAGNLKTCQTKSIKSYIFYRAKEITKKENNNIMNSIKWKNRTYTIFINSKNSKTSDPHRLLLNIKVKW